MINEILTFSVGNEIFGIDISKVSEIIRADYHISPMPNSSPCYIGVFQPRDKVINAIDLKYCMFKSNSVLSNDSDRHNNYFIMCDDKAWFVDDVKGIVPISHEIISKPTVIDNDFIIGVYNNDKDLIQIIDFDKLIQTNN